MKLNRADIHLISRLSNWSRQGVSSALVDQAYPDVHAWKRFLRIAMISLAVAFTTAGIVFFFAYNWLDMHRFIKLAIAETALIATVILPLFLRLKGLFKKIILTGSAVLVGVLFGLFGQIYQTGATAFDFFLAWTIFCSIWVFISNFSLTWLLWLGLVNMSVVLYAQQIAFDWSTIFVCFLLFLLNGCFLFVAKLISNKQPKLQMPDWMANVVIIFAVSISTIGMFIGILDRVKEGIIPLMIVVLLLYGLGLQQGFSRKKIIYPAVIGMSAIIVGATLLSKLKFLDVWIYLCNSLFVLISVAFLIKYLINTQRKWNVE